MLKLVLFVTQAARMFHSELYLKFVKLVVMGGGTTGHLTGYRCFAWTIFMINILTFTIVVRGFSVFTVKLHDAFHTPYS